MSLHKDMDKLLKQFGAFGLAFIIFFNASGFVLPQKAQAQSDVDGVCYTDESRTSIIRGVNNRQDCELGNSGFWVGNTNPPPTDPLGQCTLVLGDRLIPQGQMTERECLEKGSNYEWESSEGVIKKSPTWWDLLDCSTPASYVDCALRNFVAYVSGLVLKLASFLTWLGGLLLNGVLYYTVVEVSENYARIDAINEAWKVVRDLANMSFIFILLYAAIRTIIGVGEDNQKLIVKIIVVAVLINFSLFFTKVVIDISNILALLFYGAIAPGALEAPLSTQLNPLSNVGLSNSFMQHLNLTTLYQAAETIDISSLITVGIMGSIMLLVAAFVFFAVALMFIIRYVILILLLILSPIAFLGFVLPQTKKYKDQWVDALLGQAFFAPIYLMLTWISIKVLAGIMSAVSFGTSPSDLASRDSGLGSLVTGTAISSHAFAMFINFIVVIVFLIASLVIAKEWAGKIPGGANKLISAATGFAGSATLGMAGRFGRGTIGRAGQQIADSEFLKKRPDSMMARLALATGRKTAGASFDARSAGWAGVLDAGKGQKGGFAGDMKQKIKDQKEYADTFKPSDIVLAEADRNFEAIKKTGTIAEVAEAQKELDKLKGASAEDLRNRKIKEFIAQGDSKKAAKDKVTELENRRLRRMNELRKTMSEEAAKAQIKTEGEDVAGLEFEPVKSAANIRKETYAKDREAGVTKIPLTRLAIPHFDITGRVLAVGGVKKERRAIADAIRKSIKEKKAAEKLAEEIGKQVESEADNSAETSAPTPPPDSGSTPTPPPTT